MPVSPPLFINQAVQGHTTSQELSQNCFWCLKSSFETSVYLSSFISMLWPLFKLLLYKKYRKKDHWNLLTLVPSKSSPWAAKELCRNWCFTVLYSVVQSNFNLRRHQILSSFSISEWHLDSHKFFPLSNNFVWWLAGRQATLGTTDSQEHK